MYDNLETIGWRVFLMQERANQRMLLLWFLPILTVKKWWFSCVTKISMIVFMFLSLVHFILDIFATGRRIKHRGEYGLKISVNFNFY